MNAKEMIEHVIRAAKLAPTLKKSREEYEASYFLTKEAGARDTDVLKAAVFIFMPYLLDAAETAAMEDDDPELVKLTKELGRGATVCEARMAAASGSVAALRTVETLIQLIKAVESTNTEGAAIEPDGGAN